jgi:hypothetical protein
VSTPLFNLLVGVAVAVGAFLTQELVRFCISGILFRRRLVADIRIVVSNFRSWGPPGEVVLHKSSETIPLEVSIAFIWDCAYESIQDLYTHAAHLSPELFARAMHFYSASGRFDEIRASYNAALIETVKSSDKTPWAAVLNGHLKDIASVIEEVSSEGETLLRDIAGRYVFDTRLQELTMSNSG